MSESDGDGLLKVKVFDFCFITLCYGFCILGLMVDKV